jgi:hypothetical protein
MVLGAYHQYLNRQSDSGGQAAFTSAVEHGATLEQVFIAILSSDEYFDKA